MVEGLEGWEEKNGKEGKLDRNEHGLVVLFYCLFLFFLKACAA